MVFPWTYFAEVYSVIIYSSDETELAFSSNIKIFRLI